MSDDDLRLNSISRYSKQSDQYVLEVHSHCEVPAGCGGAVLRWRNPHTSIPLEIWAYTTGEAQIFLDGVSPASGRPLVPYGQHVLGCIITGFDPTRVVLTCSATYDETARFSADRTTKPPTGQTVSILTAPDGTWRYTFAPPPGNWMRPDFDDAAWRPMVARTINQEERRKQYRLVRPLEFGAEPLGVEGEAQTVWIRRGFTLSDDLSVREEASE